ncbi:hypothetical protein ACIA5D_46670 [Actinoplanes sp. NPDC051513]|uniref:hypothetical protein n=1 Tax=Actinoplanes sp. NPDC051513 TaxID=3363908 RepID=UPI003794AB91
MRAGMFATNTPAWAPSIIADGRVGLPEFAADAILRVWAAGQGRPAEVSALVTEVTGQPARTYAQWARDHAQDFRVSKPVP